MLSVGTPSELSYELLSANFILQEPNNLFILETHISSSTIFAQQSQKPSGQEFALTPTFVLFDPGASHSFMSKSYALRHDLSFVELSTPMIIQTPGSRWQTNRVSHGNKISIEGLVFLASLISLKTECLP